MFTQIQDLRTPFHALEAYKNNPLIIQAILGNAIRVTTTSPDITAFIKTIKAGNFNKVSDIFEVIPITKLLPNLPGRLETPATPIKKIVTNHKNMARAMLTVAENAANMSWSLYPDEFANDHDHDLLNGLEAIQDQMWDVIWYARLTHEGFQSMDSILANLPFASGKFKVERKVASYERYVHLQESMPCFSLKQESHWDSKNKRRTRSNKYRQYKKCSYNKKGYYPKAHIPYVKLQIR